MKMLPHCCAYSFVWVLLSSTQRGPIMYLLVFNSHWKLLPDALVALLAFLARGPRYRIRSLPVSWARPGWLMLYLICDCVAVIVLSIILLRPHFFLGRYDYTKHYRSHLDWRHIIYYSGNIEMVRVASRIICH